MTNRCPPDGFLTRKDGFTYSTLVLSFSGFLKTPRCSSSSKQVSKGTKIRNRYNQVPHLTQDTNGKVTISQQTPKTRAKRSALSQQVTTKHILTDAHKDIANTRQNKNIKDPPKKYRLGTVSKIFYWRA